MARKTMDDGTKDNYFKSLIGEYDYESGLEDAREEGYEIGVEQGIQQGIQQGKKIINLAIAKAMKAEHIDTATIAKCTGLTEKEVEEL